MIEKKLGYMETLLPSKFKPNNNHVLDRQYAIILMTDFFLTVAHIRVLGEIHFLFFLYTILEISAFQNSTAVQGYPILTVYNIKEMIYSSTELVTLTKKR